MDVGSPELKTSDVKGKNPFADKRVRQAINMAIDREAIQRVVMRGQSVPAGVIAPPFVNGYTKELDALPKVDVDKAKALLTEAGYPNGFSVTLHCPNDRYINDEGICQAAVGMLAKIGIKVNLVAQSEGARTSPLIQKNPPETEFYLLGWGVPTYDSHYIFSFLYHTRTGKDGSWNATRYSNPEIDKKIQSLTSEIDLGQAQRHDRRDLEDAAATRRSTSPLHHQMLAYAMKSDLDIQVSPDNSVHMKFDRARSRPRQHGRERARPLRPQPAGRLPDRRGTLDGRRRRLLRHRRRRGAGRGGRVGRRQVAHRRRRHRPAGAAGAHRRRRGAPRAASASTTCRAEEMRKVRGARIGMVFQDPLTSLNPLYRIGDQIVETIRTHTPRVARRRRASGPSRCCRRSASRARGRASTAIRTSSPAACASAWCWRWRCARSPTC